LSQRPRPLVLVGAIALIILCWSLNLVAGKIGLRHLPALTLASFRIVLAALILLVFYAFAWLRRRGQGSASADSPARKLRFDRRDAGTFIRLGFFGVVVNQGCFTVGLSYTSVGHSALIIGMGPIVVLVLAALQGLEALTARKLLGMAAAFSGVAVLAAEHGVSLHSATLRGDLITFLGSFGFSLYTVYSKKVADQYDSLAMNAFNYFAGAVLVLPLGIREALRLSRGPGWASVGREGWAALVFMALFASVLAYLIYFWALRFMAASRLATFAYVQPVLTTSLGVGYLGEHFTRSLLLGGALILGGIYAIESGRERNSSPFPNVSPAAKP
jgi:drug/metabolite transporter (DMT)-like permease